MSEVDALLDSTLDDLADLPTFVPYPPGAHQVLATLELKEINSKPAVELSFKYMEAIELVTPATEENPGPKQGDTSNTMFMLDNEFGVGNFKKCAKPFGEALQLTVNREIIEAVTDIECVILTSIRTDKKDPNDIKHYLNVKEIKVV